MSDEKKAKVCTDAKVVVAKKYTDEYYVRGMMGDRRSFAIAHSHARQKKHSEDDFCVGDVIGRGSFAEVYQCWRPEEPEVIYAMKKIRKDLIIQRQQSLNIHTERDLLSDAKQLRKRAGCPWVTELLLTFQDPEYLYIITEYCSGGDMISWLIRHDVFPEKIAKFYVAELVLALRSLHKMGYVHRDVKPDNILIDRDGHVKLADFGLSKRDPIWLEKLQHINYGEKGDDEVLDMTRKSKDKEERRAIFFSTVGSPAYIAPEVLLGQGYDYSCDWWSVGIILYEMLCGYPPFFNDNQAVTARKIIRFKEYLEFPQGDDALSSDAIDLISHLIADREVRYGSEEILSHPFFDGVTITDNIRHEKAPFHVELSSAKDRQYFEPAPDNAAIQHKPLVSVPREDQAVFVGFTSRLCDRDQSTTLSGYHGKFHDLQDFSDED